MLRRLSYRFRDSHSDDASMTYVSVRLQPDLEFTN